MSTKQVSWKEFEENFDESVRDRIRQNRLKEGVDGMVVLECIVIDSSRLGQRTAMIYGPGCTFKDLESIEKVGKTQGVYVTGLPSSAAALVAFTTDKP